MNLFTVFDEETKKELLTAPLNHPNINYKWLERKIQINGIFYQIIYIGEIIEDGNIKIIQFENNDIGFYDKNNNLVTPILLHPFNLKNQGYIMLSNFIQEKYQEIPPETTYGDTSDKIKILIKLLNDDVPFYMDVLKYIRTQKFDLSPKNDINKVDIDNLISFVNTQGKEIISEYPHLKLMVNILMNKAI